MKKNDPFAALMTVAQDRQGYRKDLPQPLKGSENPQTRYGSWPFTSGRVKVTLSESVEGS
jgi:hypothetical protein